MTTEQQPDEYDAPWKDILETYFEAFMAFFFPKAHAAIDWTHPPTFHDKELQKIVRDAERGKGTVDKLVEVRLKKGGEAWVMVHIEVQNQDETSFEERMFVYHYRLRDRYKRKVVSIAVLGDDQPNWKPNTFKESLWDSKITFRFPIIKLLDYRDQWQMLAESDNPFATVVMAHLKTQETRHQPEERKRWKMIITRRMYERGYAKRDIVLLFRFIDWLMRLPDDLETAFEEELEQLERGTSMPYVTSVERRAEKRGQIKGEIEGQRQELYAGIEVALDIKFGSAGLDLMLTILQIEDVDILRTIRNSIKTASTPDELRVHFPDDIRPMDRQELLAHQERKRLAQEQEMRKVLLESIELDLELKFGAAGLALMPEIRPLTERKLLQAIHDSIKAASTPNELRRIYAAEE